MKVVSKNSTIDMAITWTGLVFNHPLILLTAVSISLSAAFVENTFADAVLTGIQVGGLGLLCFGAMRYYQPSITIRDKLFISDYLRFPAFAVPIEFEDVVELKVNSGVFGLPYLALATRGGFRFTFGHGQSLDTLEAWLEEIKTRSGLCECGIPKPWLAGIVGYSVAGLVVLSLTGIGMINPLTYGVLFVVIGVITRWLLLIMLATKTSN